MVPLTDNRTSFMFIRCLEVAWASLVSYVKGAFLSIKKRSAYLCRQAFKRISDFSSFISLVYTIFIYNVNSFNSRCFIILINFLITEIK